MYYDHSESDDDHSEEDFRDQENEQPEYSWDDNRHCYVNVYGTPVIWTDGACKNNHLGPDGGASSGIGVWIHGKKKWKKFNHKYPHTNQWSELYAIEFALRNARKNRYGRKLEIRTDSQYAIDCITTWSDKWIANNWTKSNGDDVVHREVIQNILDIMNEYNLNVYFVWIPREANTDADALASSAC